MEKIVSRAGIGASLCVFSILYWFVFNHTYFFLPPFALPVQQFWNTIGPPWLLHSDSRAQVISVVFILFVSILLAKVIGFNAIQRTLHSAPAVLIASQLIIYGSAKFFLLQFIPLQNASTLATKFWATMAMHPHWQQALGIVQIGFAFALLIPKFNKHSLFCCIFLFGGIFILNISIGISVVIHSLVLVLCSFVAFKTHLQPQATRGFALAYKIIAVCALVAECIAMSHY